MSKFVKLALIIAIAAVAMAAKQLMPSGGDKVAAAVSVSPAELTRVVGPLRESKVESLF